MPTLFSSCQPPPAHHN
jgi:hypothetical protein